MARMIPQVDPSTIANRGERELYARFSRQLPRDWTVRHSFAFCWFEGRFLRETEIDFVIVAPNRGVMIVEAKGSDGYDWEDGVWYRVNEDGTKEPARNPFEQATRAKHFLVERLASAVFQVQKNDFPGIRGHFVAYPFARPDGRGRRRIPETVEQCLMISYVDMPHLHEKVTRAFDHWGPPNLGERFSAQCAAAVVNFLADRGSIVPVLAASCDEDDRKIEKLTVLQHTAFRGVLENSRVLVHGPAGSGKTLLALWTARAFAAESKRVLFLCYNRVLAAWLSQRDQEKFEVRTFFSICQSAITASSAAFSPPSDASSSASDFWTRVAPTQFCDALDRLSEAEFPRYDAIVVDEAQDFHEDWWIPVQMLLRESGRLVLFADPAQTAVYDRPQGLPEPLVRYRLRENCRNTRSIATYCGRILSLPVDHFPDCPPGVVPSVLDAVADPRRRADSVRREILKLMEEGFSASRLAILSPWHRGHESSCLSHLGVVNDKPLAGGEAALADWRAGRAIWCSTTKAFKGLEADCVLLCDAPSVRIGCGLADLYVAASRAKHRLIVSPIDDAAAALYRGWTDVLERCGA
jgi:DNA polymerase III delta prime subunit